MKPIPEQLRNDIISLIDSSHSSYQIAPLLGVGHATVDRVRAAARPDLPKPRAGRPAKLSAVDKRWLVRMITSGKVDVATKLARELQNTIHKKVSAHTVRRALREAGMKSGAKPKKPRLSSHHIRQRMNFALRYKNWTAEDWKRVVWSDETKVNRVGSDGRKWVWKHPGSALSEHNVVGTLKFGGGSLMMWGCMTAQGVGYACRIDGGLDAGLYTQILEDEFLNTLAYYGLDAQNIIFQHDNDSKHTSTAARQWIDNHNIEVLNWPSQSPDLNPIEHLWQHLKRQLANYETEPAGVHELWARVEETWEKIPKDVCINLIESMPRRIAAVIKAKGGYIKY